MKESKISVLLVEPGKCPKIVQIEDALKAMQCIVGGDIEVYRPFDDDVAIVCNEEGKMNGAELNRAIYSEPENVEMSYQQLKAHLQQAEKDKSHTVGYIVFTADSFDKSYTEEERTYVVGSNNKAFIEGMGGLSIYASSLDGSDKNVRLEAYMADEYGGKDGWKIEKCYVKDESNRKILDIIAGTFFVCYAPVDSEKFLSLPKELAEKYEEYFKEPEWFNTEAGGVMVIRDTLGYPTYECFDGVGKYYIVKTLSKEASICPHVTRVIAKIAGDPTRQTTIKDIAGNEWQKEQINAICPIEDVYAQATLDDVYEILCEMDLGGCLTTDETIRNYVIDMIKAGSTVAPLLESIENENAEYFYKDFSDWSSTPAEPLYSAIDMIKAVI